MVSGHLVASSTTPAQRKSTVCVRQIASATKRVLSKLAKWADTTSFYELAEYRLLHAISREKGAQNGENGAHDPSSSFFLFPLAPSHRFSFFCEIVVVCAVSDASFAPPSLLFCFSLYWSPSDGKEEEGWRKRGEETSGLGFTHIDMEKTRTGNCMRNNLW